MKISTIVRCKRLSLICFYIFLVCGIINIVLGIVQTVNSEATSFPWYSPIILVGMYYIIPLILLIALYIFFRIKERKKQQDEKVI